MATKGSVRRVAFCLIRCPKLPAIKLKVIAIRTLLVYEASSITDDDDAITLLSPGEVSWCRSTTKVTDGSPSTHTGTHGNTLCLATTTMAYRRVR